VIILLIPLFFALTILGLLMLAAWLVQ